MMAMAEPSELDRMVSGNKGRARNTSPKELSRRKQKDEIALAKAQRKRARKAAKRGTL